jgi:hypothetical protein
VVTASRFNDQKRLVTINKKENPQKMKHNSFFLTSAITFCQALERRRVFLLADMRRKMLF